MLETRDVSKAHPVLRRGIEEFLIRSKAAGLNVTITCTLRDNEFQNSLYAKGRTTSGNIVTNARGGESFHNYGMAFDICKNDKNNAFGDKDFFKKCGAIWVEMGGVWGGTFSKLVDMPHFEFSNGLTTKQLQKGSKMADTCKMKWENEVEDEEMVEKVNYLVDGKEVTLNTIVKDGKNYPELRELTKLGLKVDYDKAAKLPVINSK